MTHPRRYCASCTSPLKPGAYRRCPRGCGADLCKRGPCTKRHGPNCAIYQIEQSNTEKPMDVNDVVEQQIAAATAKRAQQKRQRDELAEAREHGVASRHRTKDARTRLAERLGSRLGLAALRHDPQGVALAFASMPDTEVRRAAAVALTVLGELAATASRENRETTAAALSRLAGDGPRPGA